MKGKYFPVSSEKMEGYRAQGTCRLQVQGRLLQAWKDGCNLPGSRARRAAGAPGEAFERTD